MHSFPSRQACSGAHRDIEGEVFSPAKAITQASSFIKKSRTAPKKAGSFARARISANDAPLAFKNTGKTSSCAASHAKACKPTVSERSRFKGIFSFMAGGISELETIS